MKLERDGAGSGCGGGEDKRYQSAVKIIREDINIIEVRERQTVLGRDCAHTNQGRLRVRGRGSETM